MKAPKTQVEMYFQRRESFRQIPLDAACVSMTQGDHVAAILLTHFANLCRPGPYAPTLVEKQGFRWTPVSWDQIWKAVRIGPKQGRRALKKLEALQFVKASVFQLTKGGLTSLHVRLLEENFVAAWEREDKGHAPVFLMDFPEEDAS